MVDQDEKETLEHRSLAVTKEVSKGHNTFRDDVSRGSRQSAQSKRKLNVDTGKQLHDAMLRYSHQKQPNSGEKKKMGL